MKHKSEVFDKYCEFKSIEKQTGCSIKTMKSDNGGEYKSNKFVSFCNQFEINREYYIPYTTQQNGLAKRKNRSIVKTAQCMLEQFGMPHFLWAEVCNRNTVVHILNRRLHKSLRDVTTEEVFPGVKPSADHLRVFGSPAYSYIPSDKRTKLEATSKRGMFVENSDDYKAIEYSLLV